MEENQVEESRAGVREKRGGWGAEPRASREKYVDENLCKEIKRSAFTRFVGLLGFPYSTLGKPNIVYDEPKKAFGHKGLVFGG